MRDFTVSGVVVNSNTGRVKIMSFAPDLYQSFPGRHVVVDELKGQPKGTFVKLAFWRLNVCTKLVDYHIEENQL